MTQANFRIAVAMLMGFGVAAQAEDQAPQPPPAEAAPVEASGLAPTELDRVVVTATKTSASYEKTMASVSSLDSKFILERGATNFSELVDYTPNATISISGSAAQFIVRGLGTTDTNAGFDPSVGTVVDGVYYGRANFLSAFFNDMDKFELLRGPQGTLFGKNATAGLFNIVTNKPGKKLKFDGVMLARGYADISIRPALSLPVTENFGLRISGNFKNGSRGTLFNTYLQRPEENEEQGDFRVRGRWVGDSGVSVDGSIFTSHFTQNNSGFVLTTLQPTMKATITRYDPLFDNEPKARKVSTNFPSAEQSLNQGISATVEAPLPDFGGINNLRITSISAYAKSNAKHRDIDADFSPIPFISDSLRKPQVYKQLSEEVRFTGSGSDFFGYGHGITFITGIYALKSKYDASDVFRLESLAGAADYCTSAEAGQSNCNGIVPGGGGTIASLVSGPLAALTPFLGPDINDQKVETELDQSERSYAVFGQFEYSFLRRWAIIGGMRYGSEKKSALLSSQASSPLVQAIAGSDNFDKMPITRKEQDFSPKGGIRWSPTENVSSYFTWSRGYKSGGFNGLPLRNSQNDYGPERASSYEFGSKARLNNGKVRLSASLFSTDFDNLQVATFQGNRFIVLNAAAARSQGAEMDLQYLPEILPFVFLRASAGYADSRYTNYKNGPCFSDGSPGQGNCTITSGPPNPALPCNDASNPCTGAQDLTGARTPYGSKWTASITPNIFFPLGNGLSGVLGIDWLFRSARYLDADNDRRKLQAGTDVFNTLLTVTDASKKWGLTFEVRNIGDTRSYDQRLGQPLAPGNFASNGLSEARTYSQTIYYSF